MADKNLEDLYKSIYEKKADKDYDGDGKVESGSKEHAGAVHNAIQRKKGLKPDGQDTRREEVEYVEEDSRRMSNKQHTQRVRQNIKAFGSNFTPPNNYDPDANRGQGEVLTRKQIEKKRRKALRQEGVDQVDEGLSGERYKAALKKGKQYSRRVSADPEKRATRGGRGGESDFGAGDRGAGNKAARRAGTYQEEFIADAVAEAAEKKLDILPKDQVNTVKVHGKKGSGNANGVTESKEVMKSVVSRFRDKMKEREEQGKEAEKFAADTCDKCGKFPCECDDRARKTSMDLYKNKLRARGLKMSFEPEGDNIDEVTYPSDFKKGSGVAKKKYGRPKQHDQETDKYGRRKTVDEETEDSLKDKRMERGGVDGNKRYDRPPAKKASNAELGIKPGKTAVQKELEKRHGKGASAMDIVRAELEKKHGKGAVMSTKKKEEKEEENEKEED